MNRRFLIIFFIMSCAVSGCRQAQMVLYERLLADLTNQNNIASIDVPATTMICSYDRKGANEDYNHFQGKTREGDLILSDLRGPGVLSRFWFTGVPADAKIKFFFDSEKTPRLSFTWEDLRAGFPPFDTAPVSVDEQNCWYTFLPIPFHKRLLITTEDRGYAYGGSTKFYYQLNWHRMPRGHTVESFALPLTQPQAQRLAEVGQIWQRMEFGSIPDPSADFNVAAGQRVEIWSGKGPAALQALTILPDISDVKSAEERDRMLREVLLQIYWDESSAPSVNVPLGDFFGSVWQRWRSESMYFGSRGDAFFCRFPMPFKTSARIELVNQSRHSLPLRVGVSMGDIQPGGYFHADWRSSPASAVGRPHEVLAVDGRGRYAGCILSVVSADRSFWVLESDESMVIDGKLTWHGTGLEDYFNAGWYYGNVFARPLQGLPIKSPFRTVQYRMHLTDPVIFDRSFKMNFERGPEQKSRAAYESVAFYYLDRPEAARSVPGNRSVPVDAVQPYTLMTDLWNFERFGDLRGQIDYIDRYLEQFNPPFAETLVMRKAACRLEQSEITAADFLKSIEPFSHSTNHVVRQQQEALKALYSEPDYVLIQFYANMKSELYLDGERILAAGDPQQPVFIVRRMLPGRHVLSAASAAQNYPIWTQVTVRNADEFLMGTDGSWKHAINPAGSWSAIGYDDSGWSGFTGYDARVKGPPEEPYVWVHPDPFVNTLSKSSGLRPSLKWPDGKGRVVYRKVFEIEFSERKNYGH